MKLKPNNIKLKLIIIKLRSLLELKNIENLTNLDAKYANRDAKAFRTYATRALELNLLILKILIDDKATRSESLKALKFGYQRLLVKVVKIFTFSLQVTV